MAVENVSSMETFYIHIPTLICKIRKKKNYVLQICLYTVTHVLRHLSKLIDVWADILEELDGKMTRKKKESIATIQLNAYISQELKGTVSLVRARAA